MGPQFLIHFRIPLAFFFVSISACNAFVGMAAFLRSSPFLTFAWQKPRKMLSALWCFVSGGTMQR